MSSAITNDKMDSETQMNVNDLPLEFKVCIKSHLVSSIAIKTNKNLPWNYCSTELITFSITNIPVNIFKKSDEITVQKMFAHYTV